MQTIQLFFSFPFSSLLSTIQIYSRKLFSGKLKLYLLILTMRNLDSLQALMDESAASNRPFSLSIKRKLQLSSKDIKEKARK